MFGNALEKFVHDRLQGKPCAVHFCHYLMRPQNLLALEIILQHHAGHIDYAAAVGAGPDRLSGAGLDLIRRTAHQTLLDLIRNSDRHLKHNQNRKKEYFFHIAHLQWLTRCRVYVACSFRLNNPLSSCPSTFLASRFYISLTPIITTGESAGLDSCCVPVTRLACRYSFWSRNRHSHETGIQEGILSHRRYKNI